VLDQNMEMVRWMRFLSQENLFPFELFAPMRIWAYGFGWSTTKT
jgi:hypothetical protein